MINENAIELETSNKNINLYNNNLFNNNILKTIEKNINMKIYEKCNFRNLYEEYKLERNNFNPHKLSSQNVWEKRLVNRITDHSDFYNFNLNK
jgi:hypothetical protein|tara:strand:- start:11842 stop:12120 length:279 start_codon:yes stop_codon:yes gene_type:complete